MTSAATSPAPQSSPMANALTLLLRLRTVVALILVVAFFSILAPNFLSAANFLIMFKHVAIIAILAIGLTFVILTGGIDLSVGSIAGLAGMVAGGLLLHGIVLAPLGVVIYPNVWAVIAITLGLGLVVGALNGVLVARFGVAPFIATLGMLYVARGAALLISDGATFPNLTGHAELGNQGFPLLGSGVILGLPVSVVLLLILTVVAAVLLRSTPFGRRIYAIGGNERAAFLSGIRIGRVKTAAYAISGFCAALVGLIVASELAAAHPATGQTFELSAIAAVVLGGASLAGGRGSIGGAVIGACVIGVLSDGMVMMGVSEFWQMVIMGLVIIAAVALDQLQKSLSGAKA